MKARTWSAVLGFALLLALLVASTAAAQTPQPAPEHTASAIAEDPSVEALGANQAERGKFVALAIGLGLGLAAMGGAIGQGRAAAAAAEGLSRNPGSYDKVFTPYILGMVLIESLVIYSLVISLILLGSL